MFAYQTCSELIIGCKSFHPLVRLIHESHFKKIAIIYQQSHYSAVPIKVRQLMRQIKTRYNQCIFKPVDIRLDTTKLDKDVDLIISYGIRHIHDIAKQSNTYGVPFYCIETISGHMSSYGTGIMWKHNQTA
jgi:glycerol dehydrogenase-like iron-containing ADH family enzyme